MSKATLSPNSAAVTTTRRKFPLACVGKGFALLTQAKLVQVIAYGEALGWSEKPFDFVVNSWLRTQASAA